MSISMSHKTNNSMITQLVTAVLKILEFLIGVTVSCYKCLNTILNPKNANEDL